MEEEECCSTVAVENSMLRMRTLPRQISMPRWGGGLDFQSHNVSVQHLVFTRGCRILSFTWWMQLPVQVVSCVICAGFIDS